MRYVFIIAALVSGAMCSVASSQIAPITPFAGDQKEGFETIPLGPASQLSCFGGVGSAHMATGIGGFAIANGFTGYSGTSNPHSGARFMGPVLGVSVEWTFSRPAKRFGGYFGTVDWQGGAVAKFYNESGTLIATRPMACPHGGQWAWDGWRATSEAFKRVQIIGALPEVGLVMHDDLELDFDYCYPDCNANAFLGIGDFACFQQKFVAQDPYSDCNGDGQLTISDFSCFQMSFVAGCP